MDQFWRFGMLIVTGLVSMREYTVHGCEIRSRDNGGGKKTLETIRFVGAYVRASHIGVSSGF